MAAVIKDISALDLIRQHLLDETPTTPLENFTADSSSSTIPHNINDFTEEAATIPNFLDLNRTYSSSNAYRGCKYDMSEPGAYDRAAFRMRGRKAILNFPNDVGSYSGRDFSLIPPQPQLQKRMREVKVEEASRPVKRERLPSGPAAGKLCWQTGILDGGNMRGMFNDVALLSPLSPHPQLGYQQATVI